MKIKSEECYVPAIHLYTSHGTSAGWALTVRNKIQHIFLCILAVDLIIHNVCDYHHALNHTSGSTLFFPCNLHIYEPPR